MIAIGTRWSYAGTTYSVRRRGSMVEVANGPLALVRFVTASRFMEWYRRLSETSSRAPEFRTDLEARRCKNACLALKSAEAVNARRSYTEAERAAALADYEARGRQDRREVSARHGVPLGTLNRWLNQA